MPGNRQHHLFKAPSKSHRRTSNNMTLKQDFKRLTTSYLSLVVFLKRVLPQTLVYWSSLLINQLCIREPQANVGRCGKCFLNANKFLMVPKIVLIAKHYDISIAVSQGLFVVFDGSQPRLVN